MGVALLELRSALVDTVQINFVLAVGTLVSKSRRPLTEVFRERIKRFARGVWQVRKVVAYRELEILDLRLVKLLFDLFLEFDEFCLDLGVDVPLLFQRNAARQADYHAGRSALLQVVELCPEVLLVVSSIDPVRIGIDSRFEAAIPI